MKINFIKTITLAALVGIGFTSCEDFLVKPTEDNYVADGYYKTDEQCLAGTAYLYSSPWSDFTRPFIKVGEILAGNYYPGTNNPYLDLTVNSSDPDLTSMSQSLWSVVAHCNTIYNYIKASSGPSQAAKNQTMGECLLWKAAAYMFLVRTYGEIPIIHDNSASLESGDYASVPKVQRKDVYEYIIMTLDKAVALLPTKPMQPGRVDKAAAYGLRAKAYLTKAGVTGTIDEKDIDEAINNADTCFHVAEYLHDTQAEYHNLMPTYSDLFRLSHNVNEETLIAWRWNAKNNEWTDQSFMQSDYGTEGFSEFGDIWGGWAGMSTDLQEAFGVRMLEQTPDVWLHHQDTRLKATMMLPGFTYEYFWQDKGGFNWLKFCYDKEYNPSAYNNATLGRLAMECPTGAAVVKHLWGNGYDHMAGVGHAAGRMASSLSTPLLRLADVKLILAEAQFIKLFKNNPQAGSTEDSRVTKPLNEVRKRAGLPELQKVTWNDIWNERRLELAFEGDRWYDFVRVSYYNAEYVIEQLKAQRRNLLEGVETVIYNWYASGMKDWVVDPSYKYDDKNPLSETAIKGLMKKAPEANDKLYLCLPLTAKDVEINPNLGSNVDAVSVDVRKTYSY